MDKQLMVVVIVALVMLASIIKSFVKYGGRRNLPVAAPDPDASRMREELRTLKERVAVLERIATDKHNLLEQEFDRLRDAPARAPSRES